MSVRKLRWGILGTAKIKERLVPAFNAADNATIVAVASRDRDRAEAAVKCIEGAKAHSSYESLLDDPEVEAIYNPLPNSLHAQWTRRAADRGKHVLCEKPLTPDAQSAAELVAYCLSKNVRLMDGFMWPHHPRTARLKQMLQAGVIGRVQRVVGAFTFQLDPLAPTNIRLQRDLGGGSLLDVGCYPVYGIRWAFGEEPVKAVAVAQYRFDVDVSMAGTLTFADGRTAQFDCGFLEPLRQWLEITGTDGIIRVPEMWLPDSSAEIRLIRGEAHVEPLCFPGKDQVVGMIEEFGCSVFEDREPSPAPGEAVKTLKVLDALARSAREGSAIEII